VVAHQHWRTAQADMLPARRSIARSSQVNGCRLLQEVVGIQDLALFMLCLCKQRFAVAETDRTCRADECTGGAEILGATVGT
jgi:hypothetical protein